jgi:hypothetical protein
VSAFLLHFLQQHIPTSHSNSTPLASAIVATYAAVFVCERGFLSAAELRCCAAAMMACMWDYEVDIKVRRWQTV